jgi:hypothetical protein
MDGLNVVAGIVQQLVRTGLFLREMRAEQGKVGGVEPSQQVVEWPIALVGFQTGMRWHFCLPFLP